MEYKYLSFEVVDLIKDKIKDLYEELKTKRCDYDTPIHCRHIGTAIVKLNCDYDTTVMAEVRKLLETECMELNSADPITGPIFPNAIYQTSNRVADEDGNVSDVMVRNSLTFELVYIRTIMIGAFVDVLEKNIGSMVSADRSGFEIRSFVFEKSKDARFDMTTEHFKKAVEAIKSNPEYKGIEVIATVFHGARHQHYPESFFDDYIEPVSVEIIKHAKEDSKDIILHTELGEE